MKQATPDTRTVLLHAAIACFADTGYEGTSNRMIADRAQRPLSLLSHHFGNKEGLYVAVFQIILRDLSGLEAVQKLIEKKGGPRDKSEAIRVLRELVHLFYKETSPETFLNDPVKDAAMRLWLREMRSPHPGLHELILNQVGPRIEILRKCIQTLRPELSQSEVTFLGSAILGLITHHGLMYGLNKVIWGDFEAPESHFQASEMLVSLCLHGLLGVDSPC